MMSATCSLFAQQRDEFLELRIAFGETNALGDAAAHDLRPAIGGESEDADLHAVDLANEIGRQHAAAGPIRVGLAVEIGVGGKRVPRRFGAGPANNSSARSTP